MKEQRYFGQADNIISIAGGLRLGGKEGEVEVAFVADGVVRIDYNPHRHDDTSWAVVTEPSDVVCTASITADGATLRDEMWTVTVEKSPFRLMLCDNQGRVALRSAAGASLGTSEGGVFARWDVQKGDHYYGLGEKMGALDRRGKAFTMWNTDVVPHLPTTDPLYVSIPFLVGFNEGAAWGLFFDNTYRSYFDLGKTDPATLCFGAEGGRLRIYLLAGPTMQAVLKRYKDLTGTMPLPAKWSLGYHQCRYSYHPASQVLDVAATMRAKAIPCDAIYLDIHYMDAYRVFTFHPYEFAEPKALTEQLQAMGYRTVCIVDPGVKVDDKYAIYREGVHGGHFVKHANGDVYVGDVWPGPAAFPDFLQEKTRRWWGDLHRFYVDQGIAGIWNDMNEPSVFNTPSKTMPEHVCHGEDAPLPHARVHNVYALEMARATYAGLLRLKPEERPFVLTRAGFAGIQRYSAVWLGDNSSWWEHLASVIPMCLSMGMGGVAFVGTDIGGFTNDCDGELLARWTQLGAFAPFCRNHSAIDTVQQEPWAFGESVESICRDYIQLRYRLMPYLYTLFYEASALGTPLWRPLVMHYPTDDNTWRLDDQCLLGDALLLAPVTAPAKNKRLVYLPAGTWYDWWTHEAYCGGQHIVADAPLHKMPLFVKAGAVIPMAPVANYCGERPEDTLSLEIFVGEAEPCAGQLYCDDGISHAYTRGHYKLWRFALRFEPRRAVFTVAESGQGETPYREITLHMHGIAKPASVSSAAGEVVPWEYNNRSLRITLTKFTELIIRGNF
jgi:alpha-glucosidase